MRCAERRSPCSANRRPSTRGISSRCPKKGWDINTTTLGPPHAAAHGGGGTPGSPARVQNPGPRRTAGAPGAETRRRPRRRRPPARLVAEQQIDRGHDLPKKSTMATSPFATALFRGVWPDGVRLPRSSRGTPSASNFCRARRRRRRRSRATVQPGPSRFCRAGPRPHQEPRRRIRRPVVAGPHEGVTPLAVSAWRPQRSWRRAAAGDVAVARAEM